MKSIPFAEPKISGNEWEYIKNCLDTGWVSSSGKYVEEFEKLVAEFTGSQFAVACQSGTSALHISLLLMGISQNDEVLVPTVTFISTVNVIKYVGASPVFFDCDDYYNLKTNDVIEFIERNCENNDGELINKTSGKRVAAIMPVHVFGNAADIESLVKYCENFNIKIIEDAAESLGSFYTQGKIKGKHTGTVGDIGCLSFNGNKIITCGGGGLILTDNKETAEKAKYLTNQSKDDNIKFIHNSIGYNYRLSNLHAAMGVAQMENLTNYINIKRNNYDYLKSYVDEIPGIKISEVPDYAENNHWMYVLKFNPEVIDKTLDEFIDYMRFNKIEVRPLWYPNHLQIPYKDNEVYSFKNSMYLYERTINLPSSVCLSQNDMDRIIEVLRCMK